MITGYISSVFYAFAGDQGEGILFSGCACVCVIVYIKSVNTISYKLLVGISPNLQLRCS